jgi:hypothetical protein
MGVKDWYKPGWMFVRFELLVDEDIAPDHLADLFMQFPEPISPRSFEHRGFNCTF